MTRPAALLAGLLALAPTALAAAAPLPAPSALLPWGDGAGEPGFLPGGDERPAVGPLAVAADDTRTLVSDPAHRQLLVLDPLGEVIDAWHTDFVAVDLVLLGDGRVAALDARGDRVHLGDGLTPWTTLETPPGVDPTHLAVGPDGGAWLVDRLGRAFALEVPDRAPVAERAPPLGPNAPWHATGRRAAPDRGELLVWPWTRSASVRPPGPALTLPLQAAAGQLLGAVRPLRVDGTGALHLLTESLSRDTRVAVTVSLFTVDATNGASLAAGPSWTVDDLAPINHPVAVTPSGATLIIAALPEGLALWHLAPTVRAGGAR